MAWEIHAGKVAAPGGLSNDLLEALNRRVLVRERNGLVIWRDMGLVV